MLIFSYTVPPFKLFKSRYTKQLIIVQINLFLSPACGQEPNDVILTGLKINTHLENL